MIMIRGLVIALLTTSFGIIAAVNDSEIEIKEALQATETALIHEENSVLFVTTLDGSFYGVDHSTGSVLWNFKQEAAVKVPVNGNSNDTPLFLPDPTDGSLYMLSVNSPYGLKKLQFTIQQLVYSSPCRSADGIFYTGKKIDTWFAIDWRTGKVEKLMDFDNQNRTCPLESSNSIYLGRTEYNLFMRDVNNDDKKWNITYYDYATNIIEKDQRNYDLSYFSGSYSGKFVVLSSSGGTVLWESDFGSPIVGVYGRDGDGLIALPFTTVDDNSLSLLTSSNSPKFFSTLYVGQHRYGFYALPAVSSAGSSLLLLDGPRSETEEKSDSERQLSSFLGHYKIPEYGLNHLQIAGRSDAIIVDVNNRSSTGSKSHLKHIGVQTDEDSVNGSAKESKRAGVPREKEFLSRVLEHLMLEENFLLKTSVIALTVAMISMFLYLRAQMRELKHSSNSSSRGSDLHPSSNSVTAVAQELEDGSIRVGKIQFRTDHLLGKGCEGTFVFKGIFDDRPVAVKRLLPECFVVADREVCLLRESDQHPNVIRYFCMEQDKQFRYIALELCEATLQDYTEKGILNDKISAQDALHQATAGLEHLHSLHIVHRDIKPHNVLLSVPCQKSGRIRVLISDFGLCKKLISEKASFSRKSGITGTDGWIAPEIINGKGRTTAVVDIFSLGCVFYYVLSGGKHPFGDALRRQANILAADSRLTDILNDKCGLWNHLISRMICKNPTERPAASVVKVHPAFWDNGSVLSFLQDVSDRIEKEGPSSTVLQELEIGSSVVLPSGDWRTSVEREIAEDLRKYRSYRGDSIRDLLRALRNKKHHYRELPVHVQNTLGPIPDGFVHYWISRYPLLLLHTWLNMHCVKNELIFQKYYSEHYSYPRVHFGPLPEWLNPFLNVPKRWTNLDSVSGSYIKQKFKLFRTRRPEVYTNWRERGEPKPDRLTSDISSYISLDSSTHDQREVEIIEDPSTNDLKVQNYTDGEVQNHAGDVKIQNYIGVPEEVNIIKERTETLDVPHFENCTNVLTCNTKPRKRRSRNSKNRLSVKYATEGGDENVCATSKSSDIIYEKC